MDIIVRSFMLITSGSEKSKESLRETTTDHKFYLV